MTDRGERDLSTDATFEERRLHLAHLSDEELYTRFWELTEKLVEPLLQAGREYTTPAIERSVLLRMGFSSIEAQAIVRGVIDHGLMGRGAGHCFRVIRKNRYGFDASHRGSSRGRSRQMRNCGA